MALCDLTKNTFKQQLAGRAEKDSAELLPVVRVSEDRWCPPEHWSVKE